MFAISQRVTFFSSPFTVDNVGWTEYNSGGRSFQGGVITDLKCPSGTCEGMTWDDEVYQQISTTDYTNIEVEYSIRTDGPCEFWWAIGTWAAGKWTKEMRHAANSLPSDMVHSLPSDVDNIPIFVLDFWADTNEGEWCYLNHINVSGIPINPITPDPTTKNPTNHSTLPPTEQPTHDPSNRIIIETKIPSKHPTLNTRIYPSKSPTHPLSAQVRYSTFTSKFVIEKNDLDDDTAVSELVIYIEIFVNILLFISCCLAVIMFWKYYRKNEQKKHVQNQKVEVRERSHSDNKNVRKEMSDIIGMVAIERISHHDEINDAEDSEDQNDREGTNITLDAMKNDRIALGIVSTRRGRVIQHNEEDTTVTIGAMKSDKIGLGIITTEA